MIVVVPIIRDFFKFLFGLIEKSTGDSQSAFIGIF